MARSIDRSVAAGHHGGFAATETTMRPTETLSAEHRIIERVLGALDRMAHDAFDRGHVDVAAAKSAVAFLREFADTRHHGKEEARLFPAMEDAGLPQHQGPTAVMRYEHELGRAEVGRMAGSVRDFEEGKGGAADAFAFAARTFTDLLREHIAKEDQVLFPMADRTLGPAAQDRLVAEFAKFDEAQRLGLDHWERVADDLAARLGRPPGGTPAGAALPPGGNARGA